MAPLLVFGSINLDISIRVPRLPTLGETVIGGAAVLAPGGKGANQAHAARLFGAEVALVGAVGDDAFASLALRLLADAGVDLAGVRVLPECTTGLATIAVPDGGDNSIIVAPGANERVRADWVDDAALQAARLLLLQMEVPVEESLRLARRAERLGCAVMLNLAPADSHEALDLSLVDWLVLNETELAQLAAALRLPASPARERAMLVATHAGVRVALTLGSAGACLALPEGGSASSDALRGQVADTTGAGDTFVGVFAAALTQGMAPERALRHGVVAASLACRARGAQPAQPRRSEIDKIVETP
jgi:ribokinase